MDDAFGPSSRLYGGGKVSFVRTTAPSFRQYNGKYNNPSHFVGYLPSSNGSNHRWVSNVNTNRLGSNGHNNSVYFNATVDGFGSNGNVNEAYNSNDRPSVNYVEYSGGYTIEWPSYEYE